MKTGIVCLLRHPLPYSTHSNSGKAGLSLIIYFFPYAPDLNEQMVSFA